MSRASDHRAESKLAQATLVHLGVLVLFATWAFGGNAEWSRPLVAGWASLGAVLTVTALLLQTGGERRTGRWLWPFVIFNLLVLVSAFHPSFQGVAFAQEELLLPVRGLSRLLPSSVQPRATLGALWLFDTIYLSCFNVALTVRRRRSLRGLLTVAALNAVVLAVFGSMQKLGHAPGLFLGLVPSPQPAFFASFIYHNHWGAYAVLMTAVCLALVHNYAREHGYRDFWHSPVPAGLLGTFLLALSIPLSTSRSCTLLVLLLLAGALVYFAVTLRRSRRGGAALPTLAIATVIALLAGFVIARPIITQRVEKTTEQIAELRARGDFGSRQQLYRDTWHMASDRLAFGWGMGSYPMIFFYRYNTQDSPVDRLPVFYNDAHSDWLQAVAEVGLVGTCLLGLQGAVPLLALRRRGPVSLLPGFLFAGCALVLLYAWVEFPFGNPAVVITWWLCFFCAIQHVRIDHRLRAPAAA